MEEEPRTLRGRGGGGRHPKERPRVAGKQIQVGPGTRQPGARNAHAPFSSVLDVRDDGAVGSNLDLGWPMTQAGCLQQAS